MEEAEAASASAQRQLRREQQRVAELQDAARAARQRAATEQQQQVMQERRAQEEEKRRLGQRIRTLEGRLARGDGDAERQRRARWEAAFRAAEDQGIEFIPDEAAATLASDLSRIGRHEAWCLLRMHRGAPGARDEARRLMTRLHPDRVTVPAAKETLRKRFQLLNHLRDVLPA